MRPRHRGPAFAGRGFAFAFALAGLAAVTAPALAQDEPAERTVAVERRGGLPEWRGELVSADDRGITLITERTGERFLTWDRIRRVRGLDDEPRLDRWMADGTRLWRARMRLERGDPLLAEPILTDLFTRTLGRTDDVGRQVAEGLLRCRLARGAHAEAVIPLLETLRLDAAGVPGDLWPDLPPVIDPETRLAPALAPAWHAGADLGRLIDRLDTMIAALRGRLPRVLGDADRAELERVLWIATVYRYSAAREAGRDPGRPEPPPSLPPEHLHRRLFEAWMEDLDAAAPAGTTGRIDEPPDLFGKDPRTDLPIWAMDWLRLARGHAAGTADDPLARSRALVDLLVLPATRSLRQPYLAGLALARAADAAMASDRFELARALRRDLAARFPGHPSIRPGDAGAELESSDP